MKHKRLLKKCQIKHGHYREDKLYLKYGVYDTTYYKINYWRRMHGEPLYRYVQLLKIGIHNDYR